MLRSRLQAMKTVFSPFQHRSPRKRRKVQPVRSWASRRLCFEPCEERTLLATVAFPTPLTPLDPMGSLVYQGAVSESLASVGETDSYTLDLDADQALALRVVSDVEVDVALTHSGVGGGDLLLALGDQDASRGRIYQDPSLFFAASGQATITVSAPNPQALGSYKLEVLLNGQFDVDDGGAMTGQALDVSTLDVAPGTEVFNRSAVTGAVERAVNRVLDEDIHGPDLRGSWDPVGSQWEINGNGNTASPLNKGVAGHLNNKGNGRNRDSADGFSFDGRAGETVTIRVWADDGGGGTLQATSLELRGPSGFVVTGVPVAGAPSDTEIVNVVLPATGGYGMTVATTQGQRGTYTFTMNLDAHADPRRNVLDLYELNVANPGLITVAAATGAGTVTQQNVQVELVFDGSPVASSQISGVLDGLIEYDATSAGNYEVKVTGVNLTNNDPRRYSLVATHDGVFNPPGVVSAKEITGQDAVLGGFRRVGKPLFPGGAASGLDEAVGVTFGPDGDYLYVVGEQSDNVVRYEFATGQVEEFIAPGVGGLNSPLYLEFGPDGNLYVNARNQGQFAAEILKYDGQTGEFLEVFIAVDQHGADINNFTYHAADDLFYVSRNGRVLRYTSNGDFHDVFISDADGGLAFGPDENWYVTNWTPGRVRRYAPDGTFIDEFVAANEGGLSGAAAVTFGPDGSMYVPGYFSNAVHRYQGPLDSNPGQFIEALRGADSPTDVIFDSQGRMITTSQGTSEVLRTAPDLYSIDVGTGLITVSTSTPGDGSGEIPNAMNPRLELRDASDNVVANGTNLADGRNEQLQYTVPSGGAGTYFLYVVGEQETEGDYVLTINAPSPPTPGGITVTPTSGLVTDEDGQQATFDVVLETQPTDDVTIGVSSSDTSEGTVSTASLVFTSLNWNAPQTVTITGEDDGDNDGDVAYTIVTAPAVSSDAAYSGLNASDVSVVNEDNETPQVGVLYVDDITINHKARGNKDDLRVRVTIRQDDGDGVANPNDDAPVVGATVTVRLTGPGGFPPQTFSGHTNSNGEFVGPWAKNLATGLYTANVISVTFQSQVWSANPLDQEDDDDGDLLPDAQFTI